MRRKSGRLKNKISRTSLVDLQLIPDKYLARTLI